MTEIKKIKSYNMRACDVYCACNIVGNGMGAKVSLSNEQNISL